MNNKLFFVDLIFLNSYFHKDYRYVMYRFFLYKFKLFTLIPFFKYNKNLLFNIIILKPSVTILIFLIIKNKI